MVTIVASWDRLTGESRIHMVLEKGQESDEARRARARAKVDELSADLDMERFEIIYSIARSVDDFRSTDPRFYQAQVQTS